MSFSKLWAAGLIGLAIACAAPAADGPDLVTDLQPVTPAAQRRLNDQQRYYPQDGRSTLSPDGKTLATSSHNYLALHDLASPRPQRQPRPLAIENAFLYNPVIGFSADGKTLAALSTNHPDFTLYFFDVAAGRVARQIDNDQQFTCLALSPDGKQIALGSHQKLELWDAATGDELLVLPGAGNNTSRALAFSADGKTLAVAQALGGVVQLIEVATGKERLTVRPRITTTAADPRYGPGQQPIVESLAFSPDGSLLMIGGADNAIHVYDLASGRESAPLVGHQAPVISLVFTAGGKQLSSAGGDGVVLTWNMARVKPAPSGKLVPLGDADFAALWDDLAEADAFRGYRAERYLVAEPKRALELLGKKLEPVPPGDAQKLKQLASDLMSPNAGQRRKAMTELRNAGEAGLGALAGLGEQNRHNQAVQMLTMKLTAQYQTPERQRAVRAVEVLELIGGDEAKAILEKLAAGAAGAKLTTQAKAALDRLAAPQVKDPERPTDLAKLWDALEGDSTPAFQAVLGLAAGGKDAVAFLGERVKPVTPVEEGAVEKLIAGLGSDEFKERSAASETLQKLGPLAEPALKKALDGRPDADLRKRLEQLLEALDRRGQPTPKILQTSRAVEALERMGTEEARSLLQTLAKGSAQARLTQDARAALDRLEARTNPKP